MLKYIMKGTILVEKQFIIIIWNVLLVYSQAESSLIYFLVNEK